MGKLDNFYLYIIMYYIHNCPVFRYSAFMRLWITKWTFTCPHWKPVSYPSHNFKNYPVNQNTVNSNQPNQVVLFSFRKLLIPAQMPISSIRQVSQDDWAHVESVIDVSPSMVPNTLYQLLRNKPQYTGYSLVHCCDIFFANSCLGHTDFKDLWSICQSSFWQGNQASRQSHRLISPQRMQAKYSYTSPTALAAYTKYI